MSSIIRTRCCCMIWLTALTVNKHAECIVLFAEMFIGGNDTCCTSMQLRSLVADLLANVGADPIHILTVSCKYNKLKFSVFILYIKWLRKWKYDIEHVELRWSDLGQKLLHLWPSQFLRNRRDANSSKYCYWDGQVEDWHWSWLHSEHIRISWLLCYLMNME